MFPEPATLWGSPPCPPLASLLAFPVSASKLLEREKSLLKKEDFPIFKCSPPIGDISAAIQDGLIRLPMLQAIHWNPIMGATALLKSHGTHSTLLILVGLTNPNTDFHTTRTMTLECSFSYILPRNQVFYTCRVILMPTRVARWKNSTVPLNRGLAEQFNIPIPFFLTCIDLCHKLNTVHKKERKAPETVILIFQHWLEEHEEREKKKKTFSLIPLQLITIHSTSSLGTSPLLLRHSEYWGAFFLWCMLISQKNTVICKLLGLVLWISG